jgi:hypothetical protein
MQMVVASRRNMYKLISKTKQYHVLKQRNKIRALKIPARPSTTRDAVSVLTYLSVIMHYRVIYVVIKGRTV